MSKEIRVENSNPESTEVRVTKGQLTSRGRKAVATLATVGLLAAGAGIKTGVDSLQYSLSSEGQAEQLESTTAAVQEKLDNGQDVEMAFGVTLRIDSSIGSGDGEPRIEQTTEINNPLYVDGQFFAVRVSPEGSLAAVPVEDTGSIYLEGKLIPYTDVQTTTVQVAVGENGKATVGAYESFGEPVEVGAESSISS